MARYNLLPQRRRRVRAGTVRRHREGAAWEMPDDYTPTGDYVTQSPCGPIGSSYGCAPAQGCAATIQLRSVAVAAGATVTVTLTTQQFWGFQPQLLEYQGTLGDGAIVQVRRGNTIQTNGETTLDFWLGNLGRDPRPSLIFPYFDRITPIEVDWRNDTAGALTMTAVLMGIATNEPPAGLRQSYLVSGGNNQGG